MSKRKPISKSVRFTVFHRDSFRCRYCGAAGEGVTLHLDHFVAVANGGTNDPENLLTACDACNLGKGAKHVAELPADTKRKPIECPFADGWPQDIEDPVYAMWGNWAVTSYGLECLVSFYPIEAERLAETRTGTNLSDWMLHLAEKEWAATEYENFVHAFRHALQLHRTAHSLDLDESERLAHKIVRETLA